MEDITSPQIDTRVQELQGQVAQYSQYDTNHASTPFSLKFNSLYVYLGIPILVLILLVIFRPSFVKTESVLDDETTVPKTDVKKILIWTLVLGTALDLGLYGVTYKLKKKN
jgi:hypothetical protein